MNKFDKLKFQYTMEAKENYERLHSLCLGKN